jgi:uncharacterized protein involved in type VI secretion and phage assembly
MPDPTNVTPAPGLQSGPFYGKYRGTVTNNQDPKSTGRIRAMVPDVLGDVESGWAMPCMPYAGDGIGQYMIPPSGSGVWIEFEAGDVSRPIWSGCWWGDGQVPRSESGAAAMPPLKIIRTEKGMMVTMDDNAQTITVTDSNGANFMKVESMKGTVKISGTVKAVVQAPLVELVENAAHPVVFGDELLMFLNQLVLLYNNHLHPKDLCLGIFPIVPERPVPECLPPSITMLSTSVKTG